MEAYGFHGSSTACNRALRPSLSDSPEKTPPSHHLQGVPRFFLLFLESLASSVTYFENFAADVRQVALEWGGGLVLQRLDVRLTIRGYSFSKFVMSDYISNQCFSCTN